MINIDNLFETGDTSTIISTLRSKSVNLPPWGLLLKEYEPKLHEIVNDLKGRPDKVRSNGQVDKAARLTIGLEKLLTRRMAEFTCATPVKRIYHYDKDDEVLKAIATAIENIYTAAHIDTENMSRAKQYYASCEVFTLWYSQRKPNRMYGFDTEYKLKCRTFSPMNGTRIYPLFDEYEDLVALSFEFDKKVKDTTYTYFETFTANKHYKWNSSSEVSANSWVTDIDGEEISIGKIPAAYIYRHEPCWEGLKPLRENIEYTLSRNSDVVAYNSAPILKVSGLVQGEENKGEVRRVYRTENGGDVSYVSWSQAIEALKYHVDTLVKLYFMQSQMPDISFENMKSLGNIGYDSRRTLLMDAHLKIGEESGAWIEFFERELNVIKAFLGKMKVEWAPRMDEIIVEHVITPYVIEDEGNQIDKWLKANGNKPLVSHLESIERAGISNDALATYQEIQTEENAESERSAQAMSNILTQE